MAIKDLVTGNMYDQDNPDWKQVTPRAKRLAIPGSASTVALSVIEYNPESKERPPHTHVNEQITIILEGDGNFIIDGVKYPVEPGWFAVIPSNVPHCFESGSNTKKILNLDIFTPARDEFFRK